MARGLAAVSLENDDGVDVKTQTLAKLEALADNVDMALASRKAHGYLLRAVKSWNKGRVARTAQLALDAINADPENATAYHVLAIALEKMGHLYKALVTYEKAYQLSPDDLDIVINLGQLAGKFDMKDAAEKLYRTYISKRPDSPLGYNNLANVFSSRNQIAEAIDLLKFAINRLPTEAILWNSVATILAEEGRMEESVIFYREAIRLSPDCTRYYHNLGYALMHLEKIEEAIALYNEALNHVRDPFERYESIYSRGICSLQIGQLENGFKDYEIRNNQRFRGHTYYMLKTPEWQGESLAGKTVLAVGEQGLGDEIMFASILPDVMRAVGDNGLVQVAVEPRLVPLFKRSFPEAHVGAYDDRKLVEKDGNKEVRFFPSIRGQNAPDYYFSLGTGLMYFRKTLDDFPGKAYLVPDPVRVASFRERLHAGGEVPLIGICWRSMMLSNKRGKYYSCLDQWGPILKTPGVRFVNLQYGDCEKELAEAEALHGIRIERVDGHDLTKDIDGNAALSAALDLVISAPTSVAATAASVGVNTWFMVNSASWPQLGTDHYPWYPRTSVFKPEKPFDWPQIIAGVADALRDYSAAF